MAFEPANRAWGSAAFAFRHAEAIGCGVVVVTVEPSRGEPESVEVNPELAVPGSDTGAFTAPVIVTASSFPDVPVSFVAGTGRPAEVLLTEAVGAELLVVGSRGIGGFAGLVMGSVSQKVLAHAHCPVGILHEGIDAATAAGTSLKPVTLVATTVWSRRLRFLSHEPRIFSLMPAVSGSAGTGYSSAVSCVGCDSIE